MSEENELPDSLFIPGEDLLQEVGNVPTDEVEAEPVQGNGAPDHIPYSRFQEVVQDREQARQEAAQLRAMSMQMYQQLAQHQKQPVQTQQEPDIDQDVEALIAPIVEKRIAALMPTLNQVQNLQARHETQEAWNDLNRMVPDLNELGPDIVMHIQGMSKQRAARVLSDPEDLAEIAEICRLKRAYKVPQTMELANKDMRSRSRGETPGGTRQSTSTKDVFADLLNDDSKFDAYMRKSGLL